MNKIDIAIVDDHPLIQKGLQDMFRYLDRFNLVAGYKDGASLLEGLKHRQPHILLLDIHLPDHSGETLARIIAKSYPSVGIIALTNLDNVYYIRSMFKAGVSGYVLKTASEEVIVEAIEKVHAGEQFLEAKLKELVLQATLSEGSSQRQPHLLLTKREQEVLQMIASNLTSREIAETLFLSKRTIDHHRNNLLLKLDVKNTAALIAKAIKLGLAHT